MIDFNNFNENISDEMLAAYIDGNATESEKLLIENALSGDSMLSEAIDIANDANSLDNSFDWDLHKGDYGFWELGLPPVLNEEDVMAAADSIDNSKYENMENSVLSEQLSGDYHVWGESGENIYDPVYIQQPDDHSCALRSQQIVLRDFGIDIPFKDLEQIALDNGVYTTEGTYTYDIGKVLQLAGVGMHQTIGNTVDDLINELSQGHRVIVSVDANELWHNKTIGERLKNWFQDAIGKQGGNHALIVAGVEVDPLHPENNKVVLTDPGAGHFRIEYPLEQFKDAWGDSKCFMAATDDPAPYQYDVTTGKEVPSNFAVQQYINDFVANNSYQLSPDMINVPQDYQPAFTGHLDVVGDVDYNTFKADYDVIVSNRLPSSLSVREQIEETVKIHEEQYSSNSNGQNTTIHTPSIISGGSKDTKCEESSESLFNSEYKEDDEEEDSDRSYSNVIVEGGDDITDEDDEDNDEDGDEE